MAKKTRLRHKSKSKKDAVAPAAKAVKINLTLGIALFCVLSVFIPWGLEAFGVDVPRSIEKASTWIGLAGLCVFAVLLYRARR